MACGCSQGPPTDSITNACLCSWCPDRSGLTHCSLNGQPLHLLIHTGTCPAGRHADAHGRVVWCGIRWIGVPYPLRLAMRYKLGRLIVGCGNRVDTRKLAGCGCIERFKQAWEKLIGRRTDSQSPRPK
jgi:hypothetical protein